MPAGASCPTARTTVSSSTSKREPAMGSGRRRPVASGSPRAIRSKTTPVTWRSPRISMGAASQWIVTPRERASSMACG